MKPLKIISITLFLLLGAIKANAQIKFHNNYNEPVWVALGYHYSSSDFNGWYTKGWIKVDPGETAELLSWLPLGVPFYYYAETKGAAKKFEGNTSLLVDPNDAFNIKNADKQYVQDDNSNYKWYKFREMHFTALISYTIEFNY